MIGLSRNIHGLDLTDEDSIVRVLAGQDGPFDTVFVATGALVLEPHRPEKTLQTVTPNASD